MITPVGLYQWRRLPFGMCSAPSCFQKLVEQLIEGIPGTKNLLYDIIISEKDQRKHDKRLLRVLKRLLTHYVINREKSTFSAAAVDFVVHRILSSGVSPLCSNLDAITKLEKPSCLKEIRRFLEAVGYYRKFVHRYADIADPLNSLLKTDAVFKWLGKHQRAFVQLSD